MGWGDRRPAAASNSHLQRIHCTAAGSPCVLNTTENDSRIDMQTNASPNPHPRTPTLTLALE